MSRTTKEQREERKNSITEYVARTNKVMKTMNCRWELDLLADFEELERDSHRLEEELARLMPLINGFNGGVVDLINQVIGKFEDLQKRVAQYELLEARLSTLDLEAWDAGGGVPAISWAEHLIAENKRLKEENEWQPIETAPRDGTRILVWGASKIVKIVYWAFDVKVWVDDYRRQIYPSVWKFLPAPSKAEKEEL